MANLTKLQRQFVAFASNIVGVDEGDTEIMFTGDPVEAAKVRVDATHVDGFEVSKLQTSHGVSWFYVTVTNAPPAGGEAGDVNDFNAPSPEERWKNRK